MAHHAEVETLERWFARAVTGDRQFVFLRGEGGIGKTTVIDLWLTRLAARSTAWFRRGQGAKTTEQGNRTCPC
jgi:predicted ATPase